METNLNNLQIILCNTSHPGNIGSAARAMKTMGLYNLVLVDPIHTPDDHTLALACNAKDVVEQARIANGLDNAIANSHLVIALTGRKREFSDNLLTPKEIVPEILAAIQNQHQVSLVFGNEQSGLTIEQQEKCNRLVTIPGNPLYFSLNLAQAVQIMCYEIYSQYQPNLTHLINPVQKIDQRDLQHLLENIQATLRAVEFDQHKNMSRVMRRLQKILHKAELEREDADLLHNKKKKIRQKFI